MLRLKTFGGLSINVDHGSPGSAATQRGGLALLALLVAARKRGLTRDKLLGYLWPERDEEHGRHALAQALHALRRDLCDDELFLGTTELRLNPARITSDLEEFETALEKNELEQAVGLYAGPFLDGFYRSGAPEFERWVEAERARLKQRASQALETLATEVAARGDHRVAADWWRRLAQLDRLSSRVALGLMNALVTAGDRAGALQFARVHESLLRQELNAAPDEAVTTLARRLRDEPGDSTWLTSPRNAVCEPAGAERVMVPAAAIRRRRLRRRTVVAITSATITAAIVVAAIALRSRPPSPSVAVLYFDNLSNDTADVYLADGFTEDIGTRLGQIAGLVVKSRNAVRRYRGAAADNPAALGRALEVSYLITGSVRRTGSRLRVSVELVQAASGTRVWGEKYDRTDTDILAVEEQVAGEVAPRIAGALAPAERVSLVARPTENLSAYDHFLRGNYYLARRTERATVRAIQEYDTASGLDPRFTSARARVGLAYSQLLWYGWSYPGAPADSNLARGWAAADDALRQDSGSSDAWMARGLMLVYRNPRTYEGVTLAFERAIALDPANAEAYHTYGSRLRDLGYDSAAVAMYHRALALEPERARTLMTLAETHWLNRRWGEARRWLDSALALDPGYAEAYFDRAVLRLHFGKSEAARTDAETVVRLIPGNREAEAVLAVVEANTGDTANARKRIDRLLHTRATPELEEGQFVIQALDALGQRAQALDVLERLRPRGVQLWSDLLFPEFDALRSNPRFQRVVAESRPPGAPR